MKTQKTWEVKVTSRVATSHVWWSYRGLTDDFKTRFMDNRFQWLAKDHGAELDAGTGNSLKILKFERKKHAVAAIASMEKLQAWVDGRLGKCRQDAGVYAQF